MAGKCLLDTNIVIALFGNETGVVEKLAGVDEVFIPSIVIGELYYGAHKSGRVEENLARIRNFAAYNHILSCDSETAAVYGEVKNLLREKGQPIPENDVWIGALAIQYSLPLISRDDHFREVTNLEWITW